MTRSESIDLTRRVLDHLRDETLDTADRECVEPRDAFVGAERFEADSAMLRSVPHVIGWSGELAGANSYTTKDVLGVPVLLTRGRDEVLRAFINGCAHRGAQVAQGCGVARRLTCPYHGWSYSPDGRLAGVPSRAMFDEVATESRGLTPLPVSERHGLVVVGLQSGMEVDGVLGAAGETLSQYGFESRVHVETRRYDVAANWKLTVDVNFEGYHFPFVHSDTLDPIACNNSVIDTFGRHIRWAFPFRDIEQYRDKPVDDWPDQFFGTVVYGLFPTCVLIEAPGSWQMLRIYPGPTPGESVAYLTYGAPGGVQEGQEDYFPMAMDAAENVLVNQDFPMASACQRGIAGGVESVVFGRNEPLLQHLARNWAEATQAMSHLKV